MGFEYPETLAPGMGERDHDSGKDHQSMVHWSSDIQLPPAELKAALARGWSPEGWNMRVVDLDAGLIHLDPKPNLVVNVGIQKSLDRLFAINGTPTQVRSMGVDNGTTNPVAASVSSTAGGGSDTGSTSRRIIAFDSVATRSGQVVTCIGTFTNSTVTFIMKRLFLSSAAAGTTDASGDLYSMTVVFTIDLTAFSSWNQSFTVTITGTGS